METEFVTRSEYLEYTKRMDDADKRQDKRIEMLEDTVKEFAKLPILVEQIKENQERQMVAQEKLAAKFDEFEKKPLGSINSARQSVINTIVNTLATLIVGGIGALIVMGLAK